MSNYVITIARGYGSGGKQIGQMLADRLKIPCYESQIPEMASRYSGISRERFVRTDERLGTSSLMRALSKAPHIDRAYQPSDRQFVSDDHLFELQAGMIRELASRTSCIIVGKCANHLLRRQKNVLSVYVEAPRGACVQTVEQKLGVTAEEAHRLIKKTDKFRAEYYKYYTGGEDWTNPTQYDLTVNTGRLSYEETAGLIVEAVHIKLGEMLSQ